MKYTDAPHLSAVEASENGQPLQLVEALRLMRSNLEEPLTTEEIARSTGQSRRQLESLFREHMKIAPTSHYLLLRLERARSLLRSASSSVIQVGLSCGFATGAHFSLAYRTRFGITPRQERYSTRA